MGALCSAFKLPGARATVPLRGGSRPIVRRSAEAVPGSLWELRSLPGCTAPSRFRHSISLSPRSSQLKLPARCVYGQRGSLDRWRQTSTSSAAKLLKPVNFVRPRPRDTCPHRAAHPYSSSGCRSSAPAGLRFAPMPTLARL